MMPENASGIPARITAVHKERFEVVCEYGETGARLKTSEYYNGNEEFPTTGDFVLMIHNPYGDSLITSTLPRRTCFSRRDPTPGRGEQMVAANFDYVFIMQSLNLDFNPKRMERYITAAWQSGAVPVVVLTKADLAEDYSEYLKAAQNSALGVDIHVVSSHTGYGLDTLEKYLEPGKTLVFLGSSGVGKSSLVNAIAREDIMSVSGIREDDSKGRHTTTHRQLLMMKNGAMIIDTPGMRELGMWDVSQGLGEAFADVEKFFENCRFRDCTHTAEPGCAVRTALENGELSAERWENYCKLKGEAEYADGKAEFLSRKHEWSKALSKNQKRMKKKQEIW